MSPVKGVGNDSFFKSKEFVSSAESSSDSEGSKASDKEKAATAPATSEESGSDSRGGTRIAVATGRAVGGWWEKDRRLDFLCPPHQLHHQGLEQTSAESHQQYNSPCTLATGISSLTPDAVCLVVGREVSLPMVELPLVPSPTPSPSHPTLWLSVKFKSFNKVFFFHMFRRFCDL